MDGDFVFCRYKYSYLDVESKSKAKVPEIVTSPLKKQNHGVDVEEGHGPGKELDKDSQRGEKKRKRLTRDDGDRSDDDSPILKGPRMDVSKDVANNEGGGASKEADEYQNHAFEDIGMAMERSECEDGAASSTDTDGEAVREREEGMQWSGEEDSFDDVPDVWGTAAAADARASNGAALASSGQVHEPAFGPSHQGQARVVPSEQLAARSPDPVLNRGPGSEQQFFPPPRLDVDPALNGGPEVKVSAADEVRGSKGKDKGKRGESQRSDSKEKESRGERSIKDGDKRVDGGKDTEAQKKNGKEKGLGSFRAGSLSSAAPAHAAPNVSRGLGSHRRIVSEEGKASSSPKAKHAPGERLASDRKESQAPSSRGGDRTSGKMAVIANGADADVDEPVPPVAKTYPYGTKIFKHFKGHGDFEGRVANYDAKTVIRPQAARTCTLHSKDFDHVLRPKYFDHVSRAKLEHASGCRCASACSFTCI